MTLVYYGAGMVQDGAGRVGKGAGMAREKTKKRYNPYGIVPLESD